MHSCQTWILLEVYILYLALLLKAVSFMHYQVKFFSESVDILTDLKYSEPVNLNSVASEYVFYLPNLGRLQNETN